MRKLSSEDLHGQKEVCSIPPVHANYRIYFQKGQAEADHVNEEDLDFKTKISLKAEEGEMVNMRQLRQN